MTDLSPLYKALSFPVLNAGKEVYWGPCVEWFILERPTPLDLDGRYVLAAEIEDEWRDGEDWAVGFVSDVRRRISEHLTGDEVKALRRYMIQAHGVPVFAAPVEQPFKPSEEGDPPIVPSDHARMQHAYRQKSGSLASGRVSLYREYGYDLAFKVGGLFQDPMLVAADESLALSVAVD